MSVSEKNLDTEQLQPMETTFNPVPLAGLYQRAQRTDPNFVRELIDEFLSDMAAQFIVLEKAILTADLTMCAQSAHRMVSSCGAMGAMRLTMLLKDLEVLSNTNEVKILTAQFAVIKLEFKRLEIALEQTGY